MSQCTPHCPNHQLGENHLPSCQHYQRRLCRTDYHHGLHLDLDEVAHHVGHLGHPHLHHRHRCLRRLLSPDLLGHLGKWSSGCRWRFGHWDSPTYQYCLGSHPHFRNWSHQDHFLRLIVDDWNWEVKYALYLLVKQYFLWKCDIISIFFVTFSF